MYGFRRRNSNNFKQLHEEEKAEEDEILSANHLSMCVWKHAQSPNYNQNENFFYPYSELDYVGEYTILKIPFHPQEVIEHVNYWGEGRVVTEDGIGGFPCCYNVNERYKLVSKGADVDRKIPNRIPVFSSTDCDTSEYIRDKSVKLVTVSGVRISRSCARDVARIVARSEGIVVALGYDDESEDLKLLEKALSKENLLHCPGHSIPPLLLDMTAFNTHNTYVQVEHLDEELQRNISERNFKEALKITKVFIDKKYFSRIYNIVLKMVTEGSRGGHESVMCYAYCLWSHGQLDSVAAHWHGQLASILNGECVNIVHSKYKLPLKLDSSSDDSTTSGKTDIWKFLPMWENNNLLFKLQNVHSKLFLTLDGSKVYGRRKLIGSSTSRGLKYTWSLAPLLLDNNLLFYIVNKQFMDGLGADSETKQSPRHAVSIEGSVNRPEVYAWKVESAGRLC